MPKKKRQAPARHNGRPARKPPPRSRAFAQPDFIPFAASQPNGRAPAFSLAQEARNTFGHRDWGDKRLRDSQITFVSAGSDHPSAIKIEDLKNMSLNEAPKPQDSEDDEEGYEPAETRELDEATMVPPGESEEAGFTPMQLEEPEHAFTPVPAEEPEPGFIIDTVGAGRVDTGLRAPIVRSVSPTPTDSSEEVILFKGRYNMGKSNGTSGDRKSAEALDRKIRIVEDKIHQKEELLESMHAQEAAPKRRIHSRPTNSHENPPRVSRQKVAKSAAKEHEDSLLADYIANMEAEDSDDVDASAFNNRELGGSDIEVWVEESARASSEEDDFKKSAGKEHVHSSSRARHTWDREDLDDLDDLSTSDEAFGSIQEVLSSRERAAGKQYLVVWDDHTMDECRWVPAATLVDIPGAAVMIKAFEDEEKLVAQFRDNGDSEDDSEDDSDDDLNDGLNEDQSESEDIEKTMSDEQIARLLAKQEELGMGSDQLILFDDAGAEDDESRFIIGELSRPRGKGMKRPRGDFPSASALADAYDGFDVMDRDRPSLKKKSKGRKGKAPIDLGSDIDEDLAMELQLQYEKDRHKKKLAKQEREELRAQGLLGKGKPGKPDMKAKYKEGITISEIKDEIKNFLESDSPQFGLPPMEKAQRKLVHEIATAFNIKTTSYGSGTGRFPMLIRTNRTLSYDEFAMNRLAQRLGNRFLPRTGAGKKYSRAPRAAGPGRGGGAGNAAVSYREGEVVGGSAPELGAENKGRAMLEKMGWSKGTALGALHNKGILEPVSHVVKNTKAGLG